MPPRAIRTGLFLASPRARAHSPRRVRFHGHVRRIGVCAAAAVAAAAAAAGLAASARAASSKTDAVMIQGFDGGLTNFHPPNELAVVPPTRTPVYFFPQNELDKGIKGTPSPGIVHAVAVYLSKNGYWLARTTTPPPTALIVFRWYNTDPGVDHFGPPSMHVDMKGPAGRGLRWSDKDGGLPPYVLLTAFDFAAAQEKPQRIVKLWQMALWLTVDRPKGDVEIGSPEVKQYLDPIPLPPAPPHAQK